MSYKAMSHVFFPNIFGRSVFDDSVFFHPNFGVLGWETLGLVCEIIHDDDGSPLPPLPKTPSFWTLGEKGSKVRRWPPTPSFFDTWIETVARGEKLKFEGSSSDFPPFPSVVQYHPVQSPMDSNIASTSGYHSPSPAASSYPLPVDSQCLPTPDAHTTIDPDILPSGSHDLMQHQLKSPPGRSADDSDFGGYSELGDDVLKGLNELELQNQQAEEQ
jgi:hypothetical protein